MHFRVLFYVEFQMSIETKIENITDFLLKEALQCSCELIKSSMKK